MRAVGCMLLLLAGLLAPGPVPAPAAEPEAYFSPDGEVLPALVREIDAASISVVAAVFDFTAAELAAALLRAHARGVAVRVVADGRQARGKHSAVPRLVADGIAVRLVRGKGRGLMHHKFAIFDERRLVTGSYNWTTSAELRNFENALFLDDPVVVARYAARFERLFAAPAVTPTGPPARPAGSPSPPW